jgi:hypothetical protein
MSLVFYQAARHHIPKYFETLFAWNYSYLTKDTQELPVFIVGDWSE